MGRRPMTAAQRARIFKALADPHRVGIVDALANGSMCGTALADSLGISLARLCHHWEVLVGAGILKKERVGQRRVCTLDFDRVREATDGRSLPSRPARAATAEKKTGARKT